MKPICALFVIAFNAFILVGCGSNEWPVKSGDQGWNQEMIFDLDNSPDDGVVVLGSSDGKLSLSRFSKTGGLLWQKIFSSVQVNASNAQSPFSPYSLTVDDEGNIFVSISFIDGLFEGIERQSNRGEIVVARFSQEGEQG